MELNNILSNICVCIITIGIIICVNCLENESKNGTSLNLEQEALGSVSTQEMRKSEEQQYKNKNRMFLVDLDISCKFSCVQYDYIVDDNTEIFSVINNYGFKNVVHGIEYIWRARENEYALKIELVSNYNQILGLNVHLNNNDVIRCYKDGINGQWREQIIKNEISLPISRHPSEISIITEVYPYPVVHKINDTTKYEVRKISVGYEYIFYDNSKVMEIRCGGKTLWNRGKSDDQPISMLYMKRYSKIVFTFDGWKVFYQKFGTKWEVLPGPYESNPFTLESLNDFSEKNFKILTDCSPYKTDPSNYDVHKYDEGRLRYVFKSGVRCQEIRYGGISVWKRQETDTDCLKEFHVNLNTKTVTLIGNNMLVYSYNEVGWNLEFNGVPKPLDLNINKKASSNECEYSGDNKMGVGVFKTKTSHLIRSVKQKRPCISSCCRPDITIWEAVGLHECATKVVVDGIGMSDRIMTIYLTDGSSRKFVRTSKRKKWKEVDPLQNIPISINIKAETENFAYMTFKHGNIRTYIAKKGYVVSSLHVWSGWSKSKYEFVWRAKDSSEYANKVVVDGIGVPTKKLTIFLLNGEVMLLYKEK